MAVAFIFARGGSKGVPNKNLREVCGWPLVGWSIRHARACPEVERVVVSTDDRAIAGFSESLGAEVLIRPDKLATDDAPEWLAWRHAVENVECDVFLSVPCTCPLRSPEDLSRVVNALPGSDIVITTTEPKHNPFTTMVTLEDGLAKLVSGSKAMRRQDAPPVQGITAVGYATTPDYIRSASGIFDGAVRTVEVPPERAIDIDIEFDLILAELLMRRRA